MAAGVPGRPWSRIVGSKRSFAELRALKNVIGTWAPVAWRCLRQRRSDRAFFEAELMDATLIHHDFARRVGLWDRYRKYRTDMVDTNVWDSSRHALSGMTAAYITAAVERYGRMAAFTASSRAILFWTSA